MVYKKDIDPANLQKSEKPHWCGTYQLVETNQKCVFWILVPLDTERTLRVLRTLLSKYTVSAIRLEGIGAYGLYIEASARKSVHEIIEILRDVYGKGKLTEIKETPPSRSYKDQPPYNVVGDSVEEMLNSIDPSKARLPTLAEDAK